MPLIAVRAVHLASTMLAAGTILFVWIIAAPALRDTDENPVASFAMRMAQIVYVNLAVAIASGIAWFVLLAARIGGHPVSDLMSSDTLWVLLTQTRFGSVWLLRLLCAVLLCAICPMLDRSGQRRGGWLAVAALALSLTLLGGLAWVGHSGAVPGAKGAIQLGADVLHLIAAGGWLGSLLPLALLFARARDVNTDISAVATHRVTRRFSEFGFVAVAALLISGTINAYCLVGSASAMFGTIYGRLVLSKIVLFVIMTALALANRLYHLPLAAKPHDEILSAAAWRGLRRNTIAEFCLGLIVVAIVAALGILPPAAHEPAILHVH